jgi:hypothetical protein
MAKVKGAKNNQVKVEVNVDTDKMKQEAAERAARIKSALTKIDKGGKEHTKRYVHLYAGTVKVLKVLLAEGADLRYNTDEPKDKNNRRIAEMVVKKGFALGYLVKFPNSAKADAYSADTFEDVLRELFTDTRGRREGINELLGEDVSDLFLQCTAIAKQKHFRILASLETESNA